MLTQLRPRTRGYSRNRTGCLTCRQRKKRCDLAEPICGHCSRLHLLCKREAPREVLPSPSTTRRSNGQPHEGNHSNVNFHLPSHLETIPTEIRSICDTDDALDLVASRRLMLRYYTGSFVFFLTTNLQNNCFLSTFLPMAFECTTLMKGLAAWSAAHLAIRDPYFQALALRHRGSAISNFKVAMEDGSVSPEMCLAITMVLCSMETISGGTDAWYAHLKGGVAALRACALQEPDHDNCDKHLTNSRLLDSLDGRWLLRNLAYHDALSSVSLDCRPMLRHAYDVLDDDTVPDPYFGVAARVIQLLAQISELKADMAECSPSGAHSSTLLIAQNQPCPYCQTNESFSSRAESIETQLLDWKYSSIYDKTPLGYLGEAYRFAALLHLSCTLQRYVTPFGDVLQAKIRKYADSCCDMIEIIPDNCLAECTMLFPLFMVGVVAVSPEQVDFVRQRLERMNRLRGFQNVNACSIVLEEVWSTIDFSDTYAQPKDWLEVVKRRNWQIALT